MRLEDLPITKVVTKFPETEGPVEITGVLEEHLEQYMPPVMLKKFYAWMIGQTIASVNGGALYYLNDIDRFLKNKGVID